MRCFSSGEAGSVDARFHEMTASGRASLRRRVSRRFAKDRSSTTIRVLVQDALLQLNTRCVPGLCVWHPLVFHFFAVVVWLQSMRLSPQRLICSGFVHCMSAGYRLGCHDHSRSLVRSVLQLHDVKFRYRTSECPREVPSPDPLRMCSESPGRFVSPLKSELDECCMLRRCLALLS